MGLTKIFADLVEHGFEYFGKYYSSYRAYVVDNEDPDGYGRLKLMVPQISGTDVIDYWAWPKNCFSGKDYGTQITPQKNDMVWVEFEFGSPRKPIWTFGHFGKLKDDTYEKPEALRDIKNFWFKTPGGHLVECDDTNEWLRITSSKGGVIVLDDKLKLLDGTSPAVLGDKNDDTLKQVVDALNKIANSLSTIASQDTAPVAALFTAIGITLTYPAVIGSDLAAIQQSIADIQTKISSNNSSKVTLE